MDYRHHFGMPWVIRQHSKTKIDSAGDSLVALAPNNSNRDAAIQIISNWRSCHTYPLYRIRRTLEKMAHTVSNNVSIVSRIKRLPSIKTKLEQKGVRRLSQMQDIGGCRAIMQTISDAHQLFTKCVSFSSRANAFADTEKVDDYITSPKKDGYRGIHLIVKLRAEDNRSRYGPRIEIQIRTALQHVWATAVEIAQARTNRLFKTKIKTADQDWLRFFLLISAEFAGIEGSPMVPGVSEISKKRVDELKDIDNRAGIISAMTAWKFIADVPKSGPGVAPNPYWFLLEFIPKDGSLRVMTYEKEKTEEAQQAYSTLELRTESDPSAQVLLASLDSIADLKEAYPNYTNDIGQFLGLVCQILGRPIPVLINWQPFPHFFFNRQPPEQAKAQP